MIRRQGRGGGGKREEEANEEEKKRKRTTVHAAAAAAAAAPAILAAAEKRGLVCGGLVQHTLVLLFAISGLQDASVSEYRNEAICELKTEIS